MYKYSVVCVVTGQDVHGGNSKKTARSGSARLLSHLIGRPRLCLFNSLLLSFPFSTSCLSFPHLQGSQHARSFPSSLFSFVPLPTTLFPLFSTLCSQFGSSTPALSSSCTSTEHYLPHLSSPPCWASCRKERASCRSLLQAAALSAMTERCPFFVEFAFALPILIFIPYYIVKSSARRSYPSPILRML